MLIRMDGQAAAGGEISLVGIGTPCRNEYPYTISDVGEYIVVYGVNHSSYSTASLITTTANCTITLMDSNHSGNYALKVYKVVTTAPNQIIYGSTGTTDSGIVVLKVK